MKKRTRTATTSKTNQMVMVDQMTDSSTTLTIGATHVQALRPGAFVLSLVWMAEPSMIFLARKRSAFLKVRIPESAPSGETESAPAGKQCAKLAQDLVFCNKNPMGRGSVPRPIRQAGHHHMSRPRPLLAEA